MPGRSASRSLHRGFTAAELLVVVFLVALLAAFGVPTFREWRQEAQLRAHVNAFVHGIHVARQTALARSTPVVLCRSADGRQCAPAADPTSDWLFFVNRDGDQPPAVDEDEPVLRHIRNVEGTSIASNRATFIFRPWGRRAVNGTLVFCDARGAAAARLVIVSYTGRPRTVHAREHDGEVRCAA